jgi:hypothetical protein
MPASVQAAAGDSADSSGGRHAAHSGDAHITDRSEARKLVAEGSSAKIYYRLNVVPIWRRCASGARTFRFHRSFRPA